MIKAGELRNRVQIQRNQPSTQDSSGAPVDNWVAYSQPWCKIEPVSGREMLVAKSYAATVSHKITTRYNPTKLIKPTDRVLWGARVFAIDGVLDVEERHDELNLFVTEVIS